MLAAGDEAGARQAFLVIEETGRDALAEMRRLLGVLRHDDEVAELAPQPGLARLDSLLERMRQSGLEVSLTVDGADRELPTGWISRPTGWCSRALSPRWGPERSRRA